MNYKKKGISLVESLVALAISGSAITGVVMKNIEETEKDLTVNMIHDVIKIIYAVDHRIAIDGYDVTLWNKTNWNSVSDVHDNLIKKELTSEYNKNCSGGEWKPSLNSERERVLIPCNAFSNDLKNNILISAEIMTDDPNAMSTNKKYIKDFNLYLSFKDKEYFKDNIKNIKYAVNTFKSDLNKEISGIHNFNLHSISKNEMLSFQECVSDPVDCSFKFSLNRSGGFEYLKLDGSNSMIDSHLSFVETKGQAPMKCQRWTNTKTEFTGIWSLEEVDCGIGMYEGSPLLVEVAAENGTFEHIILDKKCKKYENNLGEIKKSTDELPCGILQSPNGSDKEVIQVVDKTMSETLIAKELYTKNGVIEEIEVKEVNVDLANFENIVSDLTTAEELIVANKLTNLGITEFNGDVSFKAEVDIQGDINFKSDLLLSKDLIINTEQNKLNSISLKNTNIKGNLIIDKDTVFESESTFNSLNAKDTLVKTAIVNGAIKTKEKINSKVMMSAKIGEFQNINRDLIYSRNGLSKIKPNGKSTGSIVVTPPVDFKINVTYSSWVNKGSLYGCSEWLPRASTKLKGMRFEQKRNCNKNQERSEKGYKEWLDNRQKELLYTNKETRIVIVHQKRTASGTKNPPPPPPKGTWVFTGDTQCEFSPSGSYQTQGGQCTTNGAKGYTTYGQCPGGKDDRPTTRYRILQCRF